MYQNYFPQPAQSTNDLDNSVLITKRCSNSSSSKKIIYLVFSNVIKKNTSNCLTCKFIEKIQVSIIKNQNSQKITQCTVEYYQNFTYFIFSLDFDKFIRFFIQQCILPTSAQYEANIIHIHRYTSIFEDGSKYCYKLSI